MKPVLRGNVPRLRPLEELNAALQASMPTLPPSLTSQLPGMLPSGLSQQGPACPGSLSTRAASPSGAGAFSCRNHELRWPEPMMPFLGINLLEEHTVQNAT